LKEGYRNPTGFRRWVVHERGYDFFYEISKEDLQEHCESNDYWFYENGEFYE
jgi:hypothetical protein